MLHRPIALVMLGAAIACHGGDDAEDAELRTVATSAFYACGSMGDPLLCWGDVPRQLYGGRGPLLTPSLPTASPSLRQVEGLDQGCGLDRSGRAWCWGDNTVGQLGRPLGEPSADSPVPVDTELRFRDIASFAGAFCAVTTSSELHCWGLADPLPISDVGGLPECRNGAIVEPCSPTPLRIPLPVDVEEIVAGDEVACVRSTAGEAYCWGDNYPLGALGVGNTVDDLVREPTAVTGGLRFEQLDVASDLGTLCGVVRGSGLYCWGQNAYGLLDPFGGLGRDDWLDEPTRLVAPEGVEFSHVTLGRAHACALDRKGAAWCWGSYGLAIGNASTQGSTEPVEVLGGLRFSALDAGWTHTCGITSSGAWCWGSNAQGQLGDGTTVPQFIPVRVAGQKRLDG